MGSGCLHCTRRNNGQPGSPRAPRLVYTGTWPWKGTRGQVTGAAGWALNLGSPQAPGITRLSQARKLLFTHQLEEVGAGSGIAGAVSETSQIFWGKLERRLHQNLEKVIVGWVIFAQMPVWAAQHPSLGAQHAPSTPRAGLSLPAAHADICLMKRRTPSPESPSQNTIF